MANKAWVTLATNDTYALGALVLAHSLKKVNTSCKLVVLITSNVTFAMRGTLQSIYDEVKEVNILDSGDADNLRLLARPELGITFTKLHSWKLTQYEKCVFLDADTLVLQNCDELFEREELSAAPDVGWPDCFNSGVFVFKPSEETFKALYEFAIAHGSFDGGDQGLLNMFFNTWATSDSSKRLPFLYNLSSAAIYSYLPAFKWFGKGVKIIHFISNSKPWLQPFNTGTRTVETAPGSSHLQNFFQYWWDIFCTYVHPQLTSEMTRLLLRSWYTPQITLKTNPSRINPIPYEVCVTYPVVASDEEHFVFTDPWEEFEKNTVKIVETCDIIYNKEDSFNERIAHVNHNDFTCDVYENPSEVDNFPCESNVFDGVIANEAPSENFMASNEVPHIPIEVHYEPIEVYHNSSNDYCNDQNYKTEQINHVTDDIVDEIVQHSCDISVNNFSSLNSLKNEILREENIFLECKNETNNDAGLANSLSQLKLDEPTPEQIAREDFYRRQNWEFGNIDYMGRDSFDNIWKKISETLNDQEETLPQPYLAICPAKPPEDISSSVDKPDSTPTSVPQLTSDPTPVTPEPVLACPKPSAVDSKPAAPVCVKPSPVPDSSTVPTPESVPLVCPKPAPIPEPSIEPKPTTPETPVCPKPEPVAPVSDVIKAEPLVQPKLEASQLPVCPKPQTVSAPEQESQQVSAPKQEPLVSAPKQEPQPTGQTADTQKSETTKKSQSAPEPSKVVPAGSVPAVPQPPSEPSKITETKPAPSQDTKSKQVPKSGGSKKK